MTRISKQEERRHRSPRKSKIIGKKTGPRKDLLPAGYKMHLNALSSNLQIQAFIPKIK